jgi:hypothetical protein
MPPRIDDLELYGSHSLDQGQLTPIQEVSDAENSTCGDNNSKMQEIASEAPALTTSPTNVSEYTHIEEIESIGCFQMDFLGAMFGTSKGTCPHCSQNVLYSDKYVMNEYGEFLHAACAQEIEAMEHAEMERLANEQAQLAHEKQLKLEAEEKERLALEEAAKMVAEQSAAVKAPKKKLSLLAIMFGHCKGTKTSAMPSPVDEGTNNPH